MSIRLISHPFSQVISLRAPVIETQVVTARHRGRCHGPLCRDPIRIDEPIQRVDRKWMHEECVPPNAIEGWHQGREAA